MHLPYILKARTHEHVEHDTAKIKRIAYPMDNNSNFFAQMCTPLITYQHFYDFWGRFPCTIPLTGSCGETTAHAAPTTRRVTRRTSRACRRGSSCSSTSQAPWGGRDLSSASKDLGDSFGHYPALIQPAVIQGDPAFALAVGRVLVELGAWCLVFQSGVLGRRHVLVPLRNTPSTKKFEPPSICDATLNPEGEAGP